MTTLICSGTLFSDWQNVTKALVPADSSRLSVHTEITILAKEICQQQFPGMDELDWTTFSPDKKHTDQANQLLSSIENEPLYIWDNGNSSLYLDFWKSTAEGAKFVLFYSRPELELSNYIENHPFEMSRVEKTIDAWVIRTRAMLTFFMNNRDRCLLVSVQTAGSENESFIQALNKQFGLDLEAEPLTTPLLNNNSVLIEYLATTLLLKNRYVSELYDEVRSAATVISNQDKTISGIEDRGKSLINEFLNETATYKQLNKTQPILEDELSLSKHQINQMQEELENYFKQMNEVQPELEDELSLSKLQINQMQEELEYYFRKSIEQEKITNTMADYLSNDPLLKLARHARQTQ